MDRKATARQTLEIMEKGYYEIGKEQVDIGGFQTDSVERSFLLTPEQGEELLSRVSLKKSSAGSDLASEIRIWNCSTVEAILKLTAEGKEAAVLNFASAKNPGGGFLNGAMAQEESLAASSCLYQTLIAHEEYYKKNRACESMMYTNYAIYSPDEKPVFASVLTIPAVNMGQVVLKREDIRQAEQVMKERMKLILAVFAEQGCRHLILGAYGCGVFRNDVRKVAAWWKELLKRFFPEQFETVVFAVLDRSADQRSIQSSQTVFGQEV